MAPSDGTWDDLVIGTGMAGLTVASLLARSGRKVLMLEAHDVPGGYAHTFSVGEYRFCAQVHYIFNCGEGEPVHRLLTELGLVEKIPFVRLDPEGYDHVVVGGERYRIPNGMEKHRDRLLYRFPDAAGPIRAWFDAVLAIGRELDALPARVSWRDVVAAPVRFRALLRYRHWTLQRLFDHVKLPARVQTVLAGQAGDYLLPPHEVSLLLHVALVRAYDRGAYYPRHHFSSLVEGLANVVRNTSGCALLTGQEVAGMEVERDRVVAVVTRDGQRFTAKRVISNVDPRRTAALLPAGAFPSSYARTLDYGYSISSITLYLGLKGVDLAAHGFGGHNTWHYPSDDINRIYQRQNERSDLRNPWLFMSTPSLHSSAPGLCPPGTHVLEVATSCAYAPFAELREKDRKKYNQEKKRLRDAILDVVEASYIPHLRDHVEVMVMGTPATNARFCWAPQGNAYGAALTPENVLRRVGHDTPLKNLWLANATAGYPSVGGTIQTGMELFARLQKEGA